MLIFRVLSAIAAAALGAAVVMVMPGLSPAVEAGTPALSAAAIPAPAVIPALAVNADRHDDRPLVSECTEQAWPYYGANCLHDRTQAAGQPRVVRLVTTDRLPK
jgi:hypothetical protein